MHNPDMPKYDYQSMVNGAQGDVYIYTASGERVEAGEIVNLSLSMTREETTINRLKQHSSAVKLGTRTYSATGEYRIGQDGSNWLKMALTGERFDIFVKVYDREASEMGSQIVVLQMCQIPSIDQPLVDVDAETMTSSITFNVTDVYLQRGFTPLQRGYHNRGRRYQQQGIVGNVTQRTN